MNLIDVLKYHQNAVIHFQEADANCDKQFSSCKSDAMRLKWKERQKEVAKRLTFHRECVKALTVHTSHT